MLQSANAIMELSHSNINSAQSYIRTGQFESDLGHTLQQMKFHGKTLNTLKNEPVDQIIQVLRDTSMSLKQRLLIHAATVGNMNIVTALTFLDDLGADVYKLAMRNAQDAGKYSINFRIYAKFHKLISEKSFGQIVDILKDSEQTLKLRLLNDAALVGNSNIIKAIIHLNDLDITSHVNAMQRALDAQNFDIESQLRDHFFEYSSGNSVGQIITALRPSKTNLKRQLLIHAAAIGEIKVVKALLYFSVFHYWDVVKAIQIATYAGKWEIVMELSRLSKIQALKSIYYHCKTPERLHYLLQLALTNSGIENMDYLQTVARDGDLAVMTILLDSTNLLEDEELLLTLKSKYDQTPLAQELNTDYDIRGLIILEALEDAAIGLQENAIRFLLSRVNLQSHDYIILKLAVCGKLYYAVQALLDTGVFPVEIIGDLVGLTDSLPMRELLSFYTELHAPAA